MAQAAPRLHVSRTLSDAARTPSGRILVRASVVVAIFLVLHAVDALTFDGPIFHIDEEQNLPTWARSLLYAFAGAVWVVRARLGDPNRGLCLSVGVLLILFSIDDTVMGHEYLEAHSENASALVKIWEPLAGLAVAVIFVQAARRLGECSVAVHRSRRIPAGGPGGLRGQRRQRWRGDGRAVDHRTGRRDLLRHLPARGRTPDRMGAVHRLRSAHGDTSPDS